MKKIGDLFNNLKKTPRGKAILFFVGYAFFFAFVIIFTRATMTGTASPNYDQAKEYTFSVAKIEKNNYDFKHQITIDEEVITYTGSRYEDSDLFVVNNNGTEVKYYRSGLEYFNDNGGLWIKANDPYRNGEFFLLNNVLHLLDKSLLVYKTDYESGRRVYNFNITSTTIYDYFQGIDLDIADDVNEIIVSSYEDGSVEKFEFKLDSYCKSIGICNDKMRITLFYDNYGEVKEITSPLN